MDTVDRLTAEIERLQAALIETQDRLDKSLSAGIRAENEVTRLRSALQGIANKECVTPDIHFVQAVDIARRALA